MLKIIINIKFSSAKHINVNSHVKVSTIQIYYCSPAINSNTYSTQSRSIRTQKENVMFISFDSPKSIVSMRFSNSSGLIDISHHARLV